MSDSVKNSFIQTKGEVKKLKSEIQYLKNCLMDSDDIIEDLRTNKMNKIPVIDNTEAIMDNMIKLEAENVSLKEIKSSKNVKLKDEIKILKDKLKKDIDIKEKLLYVCPKCLKTYKSAAGVKIHFNKTHKEGM